MPKFRGVLCFKWSVEVFEEAIAHEKSDTYCHVAVAGEVAIELDGEAESGHKILKAAVEGRIVEHALHEVAADEVGDDNLLDETGDDEEDALRGHCRRHGRITLHLRQKVLGPDNRTCKKRRKEGEEENIVEKIMASRGLPAVEVDNIAYGAEGKEGDTSREQEGLHADLHREEIRESIEDEIEILEIGEHPDIDSHIESDNQSLGPREGAAGSLFHQKSEDEVAETDPEKDETAHPRGFVVEIEGEKYDEGHFQHPYPLHHPEDEHEDGEKEHE